ncbi:unnamed protein product [Pieris brassicae]|uniref:SMC hinge domain-containing protein n=1 Tax=Pieris brassicae TaxID=7116 RepID=A0A9P0XII9_PIEBR|nr:unnamed protein product [Pieris brassicae]
MEKSHAEERLTGVEREFSSSSSLHRRDLETIAEQQAVVDRLWQTDKVQLALDLVKFPERVRAAMQWVFGGTLVCADLETAKRVTFHPRVRTRCVTLDGDVFDPAGTLSGCARAKGGSVLVMLSEL